MTRKSSAFVPHDLVRPLRGNGGGPLAGLTAAIKDMYDIEGERTGGGSPQWLAAQTPAKTHATAVTRLLAAGCDIIGKTVCDEFFFSLSGANAHYGTPVNVRGVGRMMPQKLTGGSMRVPASFCGIYGIRTTLGRIDMKGAMAMAPSFDVAGWFASAPGTFRKVGAVLLGGEGQKRAVTRVLFARDCFHLADAPVGKALRGFVSRALRVLPDSADTTIAADGFDAWRAAFRDIQGREIWAIYGAWIQANKPALGPGIAERMAYASTVTEQAAAAARETCAAARAHIRREIPPGTVLCLPTAPCIAPRTDMPPSDMDAFRTRAMALTSIAGIAGLPQISIPAAIVDGCPAGLSFIGWPGADETLLDLAVTLAPYCGA